MKVEVNEVAVKSIITPSNLPDADYVINPYLGCSFGCKYCYASFMARFAGIAESSWGNFVYAKVNAPELIKKELSGRRKDKYFGKRILLSSVTDPYQPCENRYQLTTSILQEFTSAEIDSNIEVLTRSPIVARDRDILSQLPNCEVGMTVHYIEEDEPISMLEPRGYPMRKRLKALAQLADSGIRTYAFIGPLFPYMFYEEDRMSRLLHELREVGVQEVFLEKINRKAGMARIHQADIATFEKDNLAKTQTADKMTDSQVMQMAEEYGLSLRLGSVIEH